MCLHKVVSNSVDVMEAFPTQDRAKDIKDLDLRVDSLPAQRSLGVCWHIERDTFTFRVALQDKPFTRRGVLSIVNSIYDPLGLAVPVLLKGRLLLQQLVAMGKEKNKGNSLGWDDPLPDALQQQWKRWRDSLSELEQVHVPRCYHPTDFGDIAGAEIIAFSDASQDSIGVAVYLCLVDTNEKVNVALVFGQSKVAPLSTTSIPQLELCGVVLAVPAVRKVLHEIDMKIDKVTFYTDSKVVLGYIQNESRRFYVYIANRVQLIHRYSSPNQWRYVETKENPADLATRCLSASSLQGSDWLHGPSFLKSNSSPQDKLEQDFAINENDPEVRREVAVKATSTLKPNSLGSQRFQRFSSLHSLQRAIANLIVLGKTFRQRRNKLTRELRNKRSVVQHSPTVKEQQQAMTVILRAVQEETMAKELELQRVVNIAQNDSTRRQTQTRKKALKESDLTCLDPFADENGILRVGGQLRRAEMVYGSKHPVILPKNNHVSKLIALHYHKQVHHQGRQITHGAIRQAGYWLVSGHRLVASILRSCVTCKKLHSATLKQTMADLPRDWIEPSVSFTNVGFDVFSPWTVVTKRTRGGAANSKCWGLVFTCLSSRAIHIEVLESLDASSFICALRHFFSLRGPALLLRCDRGMNFVRGKTELDDGLKEMDHKIVASYLSKQDCEWELNPPHASHFSGAWERQIRTIQQVLNAMFAELGASQLTHELLVTLIAEVSPIVNARPIAAIPSDVDEPQSLSPAMLQTMKTRPLGPPPGKFVPTDLYARRCWRCVQYLADQFWLRWKRKYLQTLQPQKKWREPQRDLKDGDIVLVREEDQHRNNWHLGRVSQVKRSEDGHVCSAEITVLKEGKVKTVLRPIKELVLLVPGSRDEPLKH